MKNLVGKYLWNTFTLNNYHTTFKRNSINFDYKLQTLEKIVSDLLFIIIRRIR